MAVIISCSSRTTIAIDAVRIFSRVGIIMLIIRITIVITHLIIIPAIIPVG